MTIRQRNIHPIFYLTLVLILVSLPACGLLSGSQTNCTRDMLSMLKVQPPAGTKTLSESCSMGINPTYTATFTLLPADLAAFQQATSITDWKPTADKVVFFKDEAAKLKSLLFGTFGNGVILEEVLIDTGDPQQVTAYFTRSFVD